MRERSMIENVKIIFTLSKYRRDSLGSGFNSGLSDYCQKQYEDMFRGW